MIGALILAVLVVLAFAVLGAEHPDATDHHIYRRNRRP